MGGYHVVIIGGSGYTLMWPPDAGSRPWEAGKADMVVRVNYGQGTVFVPPTNWWHQHLSTGSEPVLYVPTTWGLGRRMPNGDLASLVSLRDGGDQIDYDLEDPYIPGSGSPRRCGSRAASIGWSRSKSPVETAPVTTSRRARGCPAHPAWGGGSRAAGIRPQAGSGAGRGRRARVRVRPPRRRAPTLAGPRRWLRRRLGSASRPRRSKGDRRRGAFPQDRLHHDGWDHGATVGGQGSRHLRRAGLRCGAVAHYLGPGDAGRALSREVPLAMVGANQIVEANLQGGDT